MALCVVRCMKKGGTFSVSERDVHDVTHSELALRSAVSALVIRQFSISQTQPTARKETHATLHHNTHGVLAPLTVSLPSYQHFTS